MHKRCKTCAGRIPAASAGSRQAAPHTARHTVTPYYTNTQPIAGSSRRNSTIVLHLDPSRPLLCVLSTGDRPSPHDEAGRLCSPATGPHAQDEIKVQSHSRSCRKRQAAEGHAIELGSIRCPHPGRRELSVPRTLRPTLRGAGQAHRLAPADLHLHRVPSRPVQGGSDY
jgi:hypothetical protein